MNQNETLLVERASALDDRVSVVGISPDYAFVADDSQAFFLTVVDLGRWITGPCRSEATEIRRCKKRLAGLERCAATPPFEAKGDGWWIEEDRTEGRIFCKIGWRVSPEFRRGALRGWNWSRRLGWWVRKLTPNAIAAAQTLAATLTQEGDR